MPAGDALYREFAALLNERAYDRLGEVLSEGFTDHHPGLVDVADRATYTANLAAVVAALEMVAEPVEVRVAGDRVFTRVRLVGRHAGDFLGVPASGARLEWYTHEIWRVAAGRFVERWAVDDLAGLFRQLGVALPEWRAEGVPSPAEVVGRYYELANAGEWERWCDLFAADLVMDEQLAGHVEGIGALRELMRGFPGAWRRFANVPTRRVVDGERVAVFSHISAETAAGAAVEVEVANYFRVVDGLITYLSNVHDTVPFQERAAASTNQ